MKKRSIILWWLASAGLCAAPRRDARAVESPTTAGARSDGRPRRVTCSSAVGVSDVNAPMIVPSSGSIEIASAGSEPGRALAEGEMTARIRAPTTSPPAVAACRPRVITAELTSTFTLRISVTTGPFTLVMVPRTMAPGPVPVSAASPKPSPASWGAGVSAALGRG